MKTFDGGPVVRIRALRSVALRTTELTRSAAFHHDFRGLTPAGGEDGRIRLRGTGDQHHIVELTAAVANGLEKIVFAVGTPGEVDEAAPGSVEVDEDTWRPRVWRRTPELTDLWGTAGPPPSAEVRARMAGVPESGHFGRSDTAGILARRSA